MKHISQITKGQGLYQVILDDGTITTASELMVLDFNGAANLSYINGELGIRVDDIQMEASLTANAQAQVIDALNATANGVLYITSEQAAAFNLPANTYSTIYVGDTADLDALGGVFSGIAETTGATAAATRGDNAFVLTNRITSVEQLVATIAHEAGHLTGTVIHDYANDGATLDDFMGRTSSTLTAQASYGTGTSTFNDVSFLKGGYAAPSKGGAFAILDSAIFSGTNVDFSGFYASAHGGVFFVGDESNAKTARLDLSCATFTQNSALFRGGAIAAFSGATVTLNDTIFSSNYVSSGTMGGGALTVIGASAYVNNTIFEKNSAIKADTDNKNAGGAIFLGGDAGLLELSGNTFTSNHVSSGYGGAIYAGEQIAKDSAGRGSKTIKLTGANIFQNNSASKDGGAIYLNSQATLSCASGADCPLVFTSNMATGSGGAIYNGGTAYLAGATFTDNYAIRGGAIYNNSNNGSTTISGATFTDNKGTYGAAVFNDGDLRITDCIFSNNSAVEAGGAIYNAYRGNITFTKNLTLNSSVDTITNTAGGTLIWDITSTDATLNGYDKLTNNGTLKIKVDDTMEQSTYVLATGVEASLASNKQTFTLTDGSDTENITVNGADQTVAGNTFSLDNVNGNTLVLTVVSDLAFGQKGATGSATATYKSQSYSGTWGSAAPFYDSFSKARDANKKTFVAVGANAVTGVVALNGKAMTLSAEDTLGGTYSGIVMGGERVMTAGAGTVTNTALTIERGTYDNVVIGASYVGGAAAVTRTEEGCSTLVIKGGTFAKSVAGGMFRSDSQDDNAANLNAGTGNTAVSLTITGGTFNGRIYGGNYATTDAAGNEKSSITGNICITVDTTSNNVAINSGLDIGCRGQGTVSGDATITFKGDGSRLSFGTDNRVNGASSMAVMEDGTTLNTFINGNRTIAFNNFSGDFGGQVTLFKTLTVSGSTVSFSNCADLADKSLLSTIETWNFQDEASELRGLTTLDFSGDTLELSSTKAQTLFGGTFTGVTDENAWFSSIKVGSLTYNLVSSSKTATSATYQLTGGSDTLTLGINDNKLGVLASGV